VPDDGIVTVVEQNLRRFLAMVWWIEFPLMTLLVARFSYERACLDPYELLRPIMQVQAGALGIAAIYVGAYVWLVAASILSARLWHSPTAPLGQLRAIWNRDLTKVCAMAAVLGLEQVPRAVWAWLYHGIKVC
jgi:hypothetical protein